MYVVELKEVFFGKFFCMLQSHIRVAFVCKKINTKTKQIHISKTAFSYLLHVFSISTRQPSSLPSDDF